MLDPEIYQEGIKARRLSPQDTVKALAIFASKYAKEDSKKITNYSPFNNKFGYGSN